MRKLKQRWAEPSLLIDALAELGVLRLDEPSASNAYMALGVALQKNLPSGAVIPVMGVMRSLEEDGYIIAKVV